MEGATRERERERKIKIDKGLWGSMFAGMCERVRPTKGDKSARDVKDGG